MATISFHNGGDMARRDHNIRNRKVTDRQEHIDPNGTYEIWYDEEPRSAYDRIFGDALREYNERQKRPERKIKSYYNHIMKDEKKHAVYEVIISVGSVKNPVDPVIGKEILRKFCDTWHVRNPNLEKIGCYLHEDEATPHVHLSYVPFATGYKNGMYKQNGLVKALGMMGFKKQGKDTAQILWERRECEELERICNEYGIVVEHPLEENRQHLHTEEYKLKQEIKKLETEKVNICQQLDEAHQEVSKCRIDRVTAEQEKEKAIKEAEASKQEVEIANREMDTIRIELSNLKEKYSETAQRYNKLVIAFNELLERSKELKMAIDDRLKNFIRQRSR